MLIPYEAAAVLNVLIVPILPVGLFRQSPQVCQIAQLSCSLLLSLQPILVQLDNKRIHRANSHYVIPRTIKRLPQFDVVV